MEGKLRTSCRVMKPGYSLEAGPTPGKQPCVHRAKELEGAAREGPEEKLSW